MSAREHHELRKGKLLVQAHEAAVAAYELLVRAGVKPTASRRTLEQHEMQLVVAKVRLGELEKVYANER